MPWSTCPAHAAARHVLSFIRNKLFISPHAATELSTAAAKLGIRTLIHFAKILDRRHSVTHMTGIRLQIEFDRGARNLNVMNDEQRT